jgi:hypothetical protein
MKIELNDTEIWTAINGLNAAADALKEDAAKCGTLGEALVESANAYASLAAKLEELL